MAERTLLFESIVVSHKEGLNLRISRMLAQSLRSFDAEIKILGFGGEANAKKPLDVMSLAIGYKENVILLAKGIDAKRALSRALDILLLDQRIAFGGG